VHSSSGSRDRPKNALGPEDPGVDRSIPDKRSAQLRDLPDLSTCTKEENPNVGWGFQWRRRELNPGPRGVQSAFVHVRSRITQPTGFDRFGYRPISRFSRPRRPEHRRDPALVMTPFRYQNYLSVGRLHCFLGSESDCIVVCNCTARFWRGSGASTRKLTFSPHVETDRPRRGGG